MLPIHLKAAGSDKLTRRISRRKPGMVKWQEKSFSTAMPCCQLSLFESSKHSRADKLSSSPFDSHTYNL